MAMLLTAKLMLDWLKETEGHAARKRRRPRHRGRQSAHLRHGWKASTLDVARPSPITPPPRLGLAASPIADEDEARLERAPFLCQITTNGEL